MQKYILIILLVATLCLSGCFQGNREEDITSEAQIYTQEFCNAWQSENYAVAASYMDDPEFIERMRDHEIALKAFEITEVSMGEKHVTVKIDAELGSSTGNESNIYEYDIKVEKINGRLRITKMESKEG